MFVSILIIFVFYIGFICQFFNQQFTAKIGRQIQRFLPNLLRPHFLSIHLSPATTPLYQSCAFVTICEPTQTYFHLILIADIRSQFGVHSYGFGEMCNDLSTTLATKTTSLQKHFCTLCLHPFFLHANPGNH